MPKGTTMAPEHLEALRKGRELAQKVRTYLDALEANPRRRGRQRTAEAIEKQIFEATDTIESPTAGSVARLKARQALRNLQAELAAKSRETGIDEATAAFIEIAAEYSETNGIDAQTWLEAGVPRSVLREAGLIATRGNADGDDEDEDLDDDVDSDGDEGEDDFEDD